jgi:hypothetical protein
MIWRAAWTGVLNALLCNGSTEWRREVGHLVGEGEKRGYSVMNCSGDDNAAAPEFHRSTRTGNCFGRRATRLS